MSKKKSSNQDRLFSFTVKKVFPHDNPLAIDLVRLMAAYNDMSEIGMWLLSNKSSVTNPIANRKLRMKVGIQIRLFNAFLHEALIVFSEMQGTKEFKDTVTALGPKGNEALQQLRSSASKEMASFRSRLSRNRHTLVFHYDRKEFAEGLKRCVEIFVEKESVQSEILIHPNGRTYYLLPEDIRELLAGGYKNNFDLLDTPSGHLRHVKTAIAHLGAITTFIDELLKTYVERKGVGAEFRFVHKG